MEKVIAFFIGGWFTLAGVFATIMVKKDFDNALKLQNEEGDKADE